jgi:hypothetical protein
MNKCIILNLLLLVSVTVTARGSIIAIYDPSSLGANDSVNWNQFADGTSIGTTFTATSTGNMAIGGALIGMEASSGQICNPYTSCPLYMPGFALWSNDGSNGSGPITLSFGAGVTGVGAYLMSDVAGNNGISWVGQLAVYDGSTLLGMVTQTGDENSDPVYLGALASGSIITSAVFSLASLGGPAQPATAVTYFFSDGRTSAVDPFWCASVPPGDFSLLDNHLQCPATATEYGYGFPFTVQGGTPSTEGAAEGVTYRTNAQPSTVDTDPSDLDSLLVGSVDLVETPQAASTPEPGSVWLLAVGAAVMTAHLRHRGQVRAGSKAPAAPVRRS